MESLEDILRLEQSYIEKTYQFSSVLNITLNNIVIPATEKSINYKLQ
jgi:hypothetical protein